MAGLEQSALCVRRYDLGSAPYQALLRDYLCGRLSLDLCECRACGAFGRHRPRGRQPVRLCLVPRRPAGSRAGLGREHRRAGGGRWPIPVAIRAALGEAWPFSLQNDLAGSLQNRGIARARGGDLAGAISDYDVAIALMQGIRAPLGEAWPVPVQNDLAGSLQDRGLAKEDGGDLAGAAADYDAAISMMEDIRRRVGQATWRSNPSLATTLSTAQANRAKVLERAAREKGR